MKKPHILNRSMFNRGGTSAYGRGITSNLVTEEQRQRFNYGGRVRAKDGLYSEWDYGLDRPWPSILTPSKWDPTWRYEGSDTGQEDSAEEVVSKEVLEGSKLSPMDTFYRDEREKALMGQSDKYTTGADGIGLIEKKTVVEEEDNDGTKEVMTDSDWMDLLGPTEEQKKRTKGEAQLGLAAGALDVFSQPTIAKGMKAASPHLSKLAQTASADQKAREKAILQGKVLSKVYADRAAAKGEADIKTAQYKIDALKGGSPAEKFFAEVSATKELKPTDIRNALFRASDGKIIAETMPPKDKAAALLTDPKNEGKLYIQGQRAFKIIKGEFVPIEYEEILKVTEDI